MNKIITLLSLGLVGILTLVVLPVINSSIDNAVGDTKTETLIAQEILGDPENITLKNTPISSSIVFDISKNLLDLNDFTIGSLSDSTGAYSTGASTVVTVNGDLVTINTVSSPTGFRGYVSPFIAVTPNLDYSLSAKKVTGTNLNPYAPKTILFYDESYAFISGGLSDLNIGNAEYTKTVTAPPTAAYARFAFMNASQVISSIEELQFEQGSQNSYYIPFGSAAVVSTPIQSVTVEGVEIAAYDDYTFDNDILTINSGVSETGDTIVVVYTVDTAPIQNQINMIYLIPLLIAAVLVGYFIYKRD